MTHPDVRDRYQVTDMNTARYQLRLAGLRENAGHVSAANLRRVLDALVQTAERTIRLLATGTGSGTGPRPGWLKAAVDVTVTGLTPGSTSLELEAPRIGAAAPEQFAQQDLWRDEPSPDDTALDLAAWAINETQNDESAGEYFDDSVLQAILQFKEAAGGGVRYELIAADDARGRFTLDDRICERIDERLRGLPAPKAFVVSGTLDEIRHRKRCFRLLIPEQGSLLGQLDATGPDAVALRPLWGERVVVEGVVHFRADGRARIIEAYRLARCRESDDMFEELSLMATPGRSPLLPMERQARSADFMTLWGAWPGDEPMEYLLEQLD